MTTVTTQSTLQGWWTAGEGTVEAGTPALQEALLRVAEPLILLAGDEPRVARGGQVAFSATPVKGAEPIAAYAPALHPSNLGDASFRKDHGLRFAYVTGAMANGIASEALVEAISTSGGMGFFGAAGLSPKRVEAAIHRIQKNVGDRPYGFNFIHSPNEPHVEEAVADLYIKYGVRRIEAAAFLRLTLPLVKYRVAGIARDPHGVVVAPNHVFAKVSRVEVAEKFFAPAPKDMLAALVDQGHITAEQAEMAATLPVAEDLTAEADSGGHTDNRPAVCLLPTMIALRDQMQAKYNYPRPLRVGAAGGLGTPQSVCAAFAMGAAYAVTGTVNQACVESGTSDLVRGMLAQARQADVAMAPAADMFEMGVNVQVLKWGTMFPVRAKKLYELYRRYDSLEALPAADREVLERDFLRCTWQEEWNNTRKFFEERDPRQNERADRDAKHKMALVFRSYLGRASGWANQGLADRKVDFQIWCGPAMGAFNEWAKGTFLETVENRRAVTVAHNLLLGAAVMTRVNWLRSLGVTLSAEVARYQPLPPEKLVQYLEWNE